MTYLESAEDVTITRKRAILELARHGVTPTDYSEEYEAFFLEFGYKEEYNAVEVLLFLGY